MNVSVEWYRSFVAVYREGTVTAAAARLFMTQPGVSGHVAALEQATGHRLFDRARRRMTPTPAGLALYARIAGAVEALEAAERASGTLGVPTAPLARLGSPLDFAGHALGRLALGSARVRVETGTPEDLAARVRTGALDAYIATQRPDGALAAEPVLTEAFWLLAPPGTEATPDPGDLRGYAAWLSLQRWLSFGPELPIIRRFWRLSFGTRPPIEPAFVLPSLRGLVEAVALGAGLTLAPDYLSREAVEAGRVVRLPTPVEITNDLLLAFDRRRQQDEPVARLREALASFPVLGPP